MKRILLASLFVSLFSCAKQPLTTPAQLAPEVKTEETNSDLIGLASPIQLQKGRNIIDLKDYFLKANIDSVKSSTGLPFVLDKEQHLIQLELENITTPLTNLTCYSEGKAYDLLIKSPAKKFVTLRLADETYGKVQIKGEMNAWDPAATVVNKENGEWTTRLELNPGNYQYKYIVDGNEINDPHNELVVSNGSGGTNSLLVIDKPQKDNLPWLKTIEHSPSSITLSSSNSATEVFAYWENTRLTVTRKASHLILPIPAQALLQQRSFVRVWAYNDEGISNDLLIPLHNGKVLTDHKDLNRRDKEAQIMYFTLVDRFYNGDQANDDPIDDSRLKPLTNYEGGDLKGITEKIKSGYFDELNINSLWLSPITQNPLTAYQEYIEPQYFYSGYHGYWPISSSKVDHRFGDDETLQELVDVAHEHDINILLDYVTNHVHEEHPLYQSHPEWATDLLLSDGTKNLRIWDAQRLTTWFDEFMPSLDLSITEVIDVQVDSTIYWLEKFGLDGYRHDATKHIPQAFWKQLTRKLKERVIGPEGRPLYQIGETYGSRDLVNSYISSGMLDSQFDFNLYFDVREVFALQDVSFDKLVTSLEETFSYYGYHSSMGYVSGNHDQARFISLASGDVSFSEDHKMAGFNREIEISDSIGYDRLEMLMSFIMTIPGVPVIYYGDEIGMPGAGDPDSRRVMRFSELNKRERRTRKMVQDLTELRKENLALTYGDTEVVAHDKDRFIMKRQYFDKEVVIFMNKSTESKDFVIDTAHKDWNIFGHSELTYLPQGIALNVQPWKFEILIK